jgi:GT2 family glycosyltransferase
MRNPESISIIIPTCGRIQLLEALLSSIEADIADRSFSVELILVDASDERDRAVISHLAARYRATYLAAAPAHPGIARNLGVAKARAPFLLFLDSDVTVCPGAIQAHYDALLAGADACAGMVKFAGPATFAWRAVEVMQVMLPFRYASLTTTVPWAPTANISFRKDRFLRVNGFDPKLPPYGGEDVDLGFRFTNAGFCIQACAVAIVQHTTATWARWSQNIRRLASYGKADFYLIERHPERTYADLPSPLLAFMAQVLLTLLIVPVAGFYSLVPLVSAIFVQVFCYAALKRTGPSSLWIQLPGLFIIALLDAGKWIEAVGNRRPKPIFLRLRYLDDIIEKDWREIWASNWSVYVSIFVFALVLSIELLSAPARSR